MNAMSMLTPLVHQISSARYGDARAASLAVQDRQRDLRQLEQTLAELSQLFQEVRPVARCSKDSNSQTKQLHDQVILSDEVIEKVSEQAAQAQVDVERG